MLIEVALIFVKYANSCVINKDWHVNFHDLNFHFSFFNQREDPSF